MPFARARTLVGLAGTVTTLAAMDAGIPAYDAGVTHHYRLAATAVHRLAERLLAATRAERAAVPVMHPGRVDVIGAGALVLQVILERTGLPSVLVSRARHPGRDRLERGLGLAGSQQALSLSTNCRNVSGWTPFAPSLTSRSSVEPSR